MERNLTKDREVNRVEDAQRKLSEWLLRQPVVAWVMTTLVLFIALTSVPSSVVDQIKPASTWLFAGILALTLTSALSALLLLRFGHHRAHEVLGSLWGLGLLPALLSIAALMLGVPKWLPTVGCVLTVGLLALALRAARRSAADASPGDPAPPD